MARLRNPQRSATTLGRCPALSTTTSSATMARAPNACDKAAMALNMVKMCVGWSSPDDLEARISDRVAALRAAGQTEEMMVQTRMMPTRRDEILDGGSLYWVMKSKIQCRQEILDIRPFVDEAGTRRCWIVVKPELIRTVPRDRKPFQGWRYAGKDDVPKDLIADEVEMPDHMRKELARLGLM